MPGGESAMSLCVSYDSVSCRSSSALAIPAASVRSARRPWTRARWTGTAHRTPAPTQPALARLLVTHAPPLPVPGLDSLQQSTALTLMIRFGSAAMVRGGSGQAREAALTKARTRREAETDLIVLEC